jgi:hypothetical protein
MICVSFPNSLFPRPVPLDLCYVSVTCYSGSEMELLNGGGAGGRLKGAIMEGAIIEGA